ncbi:MAG: DUF3127 domain-containing protein [Bacteroidales bacterium]|nr:DUF3127 domain-containing protein [Bacteroidales bacterium]
MSFEISGRLIEKYNTIQVSERFKKREFVIEKTESNGGMEFTDHIKFQLTQDRCNLVESVEVNDDIKVSFNIRGNKWEKDGKVSYFTNLDAWRVEKVQDLGASNYPGDMPPPPSMDNMPPDDGADDLPF